MKAPAPQTPRIEKTPQSHSEFTERHPAYGMIGACRMSANPGIRLYGSDFRHRNIVKIEIKTSSVNRMISHDWPHGEDEVVELYMSEAQWAGFVSTMNVGDGVQCTLRFLTGRGEYPAIDAPEGDRTTQLIESEARRQLENAVLSVERAAKLVQESGISAKQKAAIAAHLDKAVQEMRPNLSYILKCIGEHAHGLVNKAKAEVAGFLQHAIQRAGIAALRGEKPPIELDGKADKGRTS